MKIYMNKPRYNWISPYTIKEKFFFWKKDYDAFKNEPPVWLTKTCECWLKIANFFNRKIDYVKIDHWDTWSMDSTLTPIILPMLKQLKETKHGSPNVDDEDVPKELQYPKKYKNKKGTLQIHKVIEESEDLIHRRWDWVLNEMIWTFEQLNNEDYDAQYFQGEFDKDAWMANEERISNGTRLFGKYFRALWD